MTAAIDEADLIEPQRLAASVVDDLLIDARLNPRSRRLSLREIGIALNFELMLVCTAADNIARGLVLQAADRHRLHMARRHVEFIIEESLK